MSRSFYLLTATTAACLAGCGFAPPTPTKIIATSPEGRPKVYLTSTEAAAAVKEPGAFPTGGVVPAAYAAPIGALVPVKPFTEWSEQEAAADALGRIGPAAVPALIDALHSADPTIRRKAAEVLGRMGGDAKDAVPHLVQLLNDPDESVRKAATRTIGRIGPPAQEAVPALMRTLLQPS